MRNEVGLVGSPSTTAKVTVDIMEDATNAPLRGQVVSLVHPLADSYLIAIGTVTDIKTSNRWHEDSNMRGVLKTHGTLPHLSAVGDVRTADVAIQAVYEAQYENPGQGAPPTESAASLGMSPTTGARVRRVTDEFLSQLLRRHSGETISLGTIYGMDDVRLPMIVRHFGPANEGGAGEAYHAGIFGITGSGKSGFATYLLAAYTKHRKMGIIVLDPQGQFANENALPFSLKEWAESVGREVLTLSVSYDLRLRKNAPLLIELVSRTRLLRDMLTLRGSQTFDSAVQEMARILQGQSSWEDMDSSELFRNLIAELNADVSVRRVYATTSGQKKLHNDLDHILSDDDAFNMALGMFRPLHSLFTRTNLQGGKRLPMEGVIHNLLDTGTDIRPLVVVDLSNKFGDGADGVDSPAEILDSTQIKARILRELCSMLTRVAEQRFTVGQTLNTLVVFDEAHRYAPDSSEDDEITSLSRALDDYVRTSRKFGLGWTFITQEISSIRRSIWQQLRLRAFGYGLISGTEAQRLREITFGDEALELYHSFVDPNAIQPSKYPFMITGPVSPLSFTGSPLFLSVYTDFDEFKRDNGFD